MYPREMPGKEPEYGPTAQTASANLRRWRETRGMTYTELSNRLNTVAGWDISPVGVRRIENRERRITVDDLTALAAALDVAPIALLMPHSANQSDECQSTGRRGTAGQVYRWLRGDALPGDTDDPRKQFMFMIDSRPPWAVAETITTRAG